LSRIIFLITIRTTSFRRADHMKMVSGRFNPSFPNGSSDVRVLLHIPMFIDFGACALPSLKISESNIVHVSALDFAAAECIRYIRIFFQVAILIEVGRGQCNLKQQLEETGRYFNPPSLLKDRLIYFQRVEQRNSGRYEHR
jgi:hypothetical protein